MAEPKRTLYAFHGKPSSNPIKVAIILEELGLDYEISSLSRETLEQKSMAHTARHPNGKVPVLTDVNGLTTWETTAITLYLMSEYDKEHVFHSSEKEEISTMTAWYSLQSTSLAPYIHLLLSKEKKEMPELQRSRPFFKSEVLRQFGILEAHLGVSKSDYISSQGYSFVDSGWAPYTDHYIQNGVGYSLDDFPNVREWHKRVFGRPAVQRAYQKLGITHEAL